MRRKRSDNIGNGSYMRNASRWQRDSDYKNKPTEQLPAYLYAKPKKTDNANSIAFEKKYYSERYN